MNSSPFDFEAAAKLPLEVRFGTSSWTYPGWQGLVYFRNYRDEKDLTANSLGEYGTFPWFRTVGIDSTFYTPPRVETLKRYSEQLPQGFPWVSKVWEEITIPTYAKHKRYGEKAGTTNPNFLNAPFFIERVLEPYRVSGTLSQTGPFIFEFQAFPKSKLNELPAFLEKLDIFLGQLPKEYRYSIEIRNRELLSPDYFSILNRHSVTHCFNHWSYMPPLAEQMRAAANAGGLEAPFFVARILTPLGVAYEKAVELHQPYDRIKTVLTEMRADVVRLAHRALQRQVPAFILVNNRAEGNAPQTIDAIGRQIVRRQTGQ